MTQVRGSWRAGEGEVSLIIFRCPFSVPTDTGGMNTRVMAVETPRVNEMETAGQALYRTAQSSVLPVEQPYH